MFQGEIMIRINPTPEREKLSDENVFRILKDICSAKNEQRVQELRKLLKILGGEND